MMSLMRVFNNEGLAGSVGEFASLVCEDWLSTSLVYISRVIGVEPLPTNGPHVLEGPSGAGLVFGRFSLYPKLRLDRGGHRKKHVVKCPMCCALQAAGAMRNTTRERSWNDIATVKEPRSTRLSGV